LKERGLADGVGDPLGMEEMEIWVLDST
jgi:hypothetical protein